MKSNLNNLFDRGEKFGVLAGKSAALKSSVSLIEIIGYDSQEH